MICAQSRLLLQSRLGQLLLVLMLLLVLLLELRLLLREPLLPLEVRLLLLLLLEQLLLLLLGRLQAVVLEVAAAILRRLRAGAGAGVLGAVRRAKWCSRPCTAVTKDRQGLVLCARYLR